MKALAAFLLALLLASPALAQLGENLGGPLETESPFKVTAVLDRTAVVFGDTFRIGIVFDAAEHHKIYRSSVKVALDNQEYLRVVDMQVPEGVRPKAEPNVPAGEAILTGRSVVVVTVRAATRDKVPPGLREAPARFTMEFQGCSDKVCFPPDIRTLLINVPLTADAGQSKPANEQDFAAAATPAPAAEPAILGTPPMTSEDNLAAIAKHISQQADFSRGVETRGLFVALLAAFASGFLVSLTPCVWPLIPIVLAIVGASAEGSGWRRGLGLSLAYVVGMALTYAAFGALAGALGKSVQGVMQNPWVVGLVCIVFVALALSMFGLYDIRLPSGVAGKLQQRRGAGVLGVLITGLVSGLVASPCVSAPLLGLFAGVATLGSIWVGALAGFVFALGMGVILVVAGTSSKALAALPRSGEWMVSVKHFFGWVMLAVAVYFSQMALGPGYFNAGMLALFATAIGHAAGAFKTSRHKPALCVGIILLLCGLAYFLRASASEPTRVTASSAGEAAIAWETSLNAGLARAKAEGKPAIVDGWADWCVYCHEMDREVFSRKEVADESRRFVMIRLDATVQSRPVLDVLTRYGIIGLPAYVFVRTDGTHETVQGKLDLETFLSLMRATK